MSILTSSVATLGFFLSGAGAGCALEDSGREDSGVASGGEAFGVSTTGGTSSEGGATKVEGSTSDKDTSSPV